MAERAPKLGEYRRKRDFGRTPEPEGGVPVGRGQRLEFVVQKHQARHLHYDLRLELEGVMKSWAVPKGPSPNPAAKRLAMEVEDHPVEYNDFEGTIPRGEYGGGTVMLWDRGWYEPTERKSGESAEKTLKRGYQKGHLRVRLHGERMTGEYHLVRKEVAEGGRAAWLLIKADDEHASRRRELTEEHTTSVVSGRAMEEIAAGTGGARVWRSNRSADAVERKAAAAPQAAAVLPMLAARGDRRPTGREWTFEPKLDGIRVLAYATEGGSALVTRNGNDKAGAFPEVAEALSRLARHAGRPVVLDGELVAVRGGQVQRFEQLQGRMHVGDAAKAARLAEREPAALVAFDLLADGEEALFTAPWTVRRRSLEDVLKGWPGERIRLGETDPDGARMERRARDGGWEGIVAKRVDRPYRPGERSRDWLKLKLENRQELVIGGWTEPRGSRKHLGSLLLGYYDADGKLCYAGHTGTGFTREMLGTLAAKLARLERKTSPFHGRPPRTNQPAHWVTPRLVAEIQFSEWTSEGKLRQPVFAGLRDDKDPRSVAREPRGPGRPPTPRSAPSPPPPRRRAARRGAPPHRRALAEIRRVGARHPRGGQLSWPGGRLEVTSLDKVFFPDRGVAKGDVLAYYAEMADLVLPWMADRPLVLKRYPNGIDGEAFYQQSAPEEVPEGVRAETVVFGEKQKAHTRLVGGDLATLLYTVQLGAISYDPWHSRVGALESADYTVIDLDPGEGATFRTAVQVARWVREEMDALGLHGALKTSGSRGLHVYLPLPAGTPLEAATLVAQIVGTRVARQHPEHATVTRTVKRRPRGTVYVDYLQNILGKTVAGVYAVRARPGAPVSTPLDWDELTDDLDPREFTLETVPARVKARGELWGVGMREPNALEGLLPSGEE